jgi:hypothetical protein
MYENACGWSPDDALVVEAEEPRDWFDAGWAVGMAGVGAGAYLPPLDDTLAQRWWLGGFGAAWADADTVETSIDVALARALGGQRELLLQLRRHKAESRTMQ